LWWLSAEGKTTVLAAAATFLLICIAYRLTFLASNCYLCLWPLTSH
jgi:hypothetical protein